MASLTLEILEPAHQANVVGNAAITVRFQGRAIAPPVPLFYTWYTMPAATADPSGALNAPGDDATSAALDFTKPLSVGSYAITFSAKDRPGMKLENIKAVVHAGFIGGAEKQGIDKPCVIHVLQATLFTPDDNVTIARTNLILKAKAPILWNDAEYQKINSIQYRWKWNPVGNPPNRLKLDQVIPLQQLIFNTKDSTVGNQPSVTYQANLQNQLSTGVYTLTLRVENAKNPTQGHEVSRSITLS